LPPRNSIQVALRGEDGGGSIADVERTNTASRWTLTVPSAHTEVARDEFVRHALRKTADDVELAFGETKPAARSSDAEPRGVGAGGRALDERGGT
jgi:hypothetical protein